MNEYKYLLIYTDGACITTTPAVTLEDARKRMRQQAVHIAEAGSRSTFTEFDAKVENPTDDESIKVHLWSIVPLEYYPNDYDA